MTYYNPQLYAFNERSRVQQVPCYPVIPANITEVTLMFALVGAGGSASLAPGTGGGGGLFIGQVTLPTNIMVNGSYVNQYIYTSASRGGEGTSSSTFISLQETASGTPLYGEPYVTNGTNSSPSLGGTAGLGGSYNANNLILRDTNNNTYSIEQLQGTNGTPGNTGGVGTQPGISAWWQQPNWPFITFPNENNNPGVIQSTGVGGVVITDEFGNIFYGPGDNGMVILQFNYTGFCYDIAISSALYNYDIPFYYTANNIIPVPFVKQDETGNVPVTFVIQGSGGNGNTFLSMNCPSQGNFSPVGGDGGGLPSLTIFGGGGGAALKGVVSLPPETGIFIHVAGGGTQSDDGTYITIDVIPDGYIGQPPTGSGQTYVSPWVSGGTNVPQTGNIMDDYSGSGGNYYNEDYIQDGNTLSYPVTIINNQNGNTSYFSCNEGQLTPALAAWVPPNDNYLAYSNTGVQQSAVVPSVTPFDYGQGGQDLYNPGGTGGIIMVGFGVDIPWTVDTISEYRRRQALKRIPCFVPDTRILTPLGYTPVQNIPNGGLITTDKGKHVPVKVLVRTLSYTDRENAPYLIPKNSLGPFMPAADLRLSPLHAFRLQPDLWHIPKYAANENRQIKQYDVGKPITYYHLECPNYFTDNLMADGCIVESYGRNQVEEESTLYAYDQRRKGFVRTAKPKNVVMYRR
jgi:hypothetical protein